MTIIVTLAGILFVLLAIINQGRGVKAFLSLFVNFFMIVAAVWLITKGWNAILIAFIFSMVTSGFILFFINGINSKTKISYYAVAVTLLLVGILILYVGYAGHLSGFGMHLNDMYYRYEPNVSINFTPVAIAVILIGLTGAITDTALDIATSLHEVHENNKHLSFKELIHSGNHMGKDILGTMINTLFFVFLGEIMAFILAFQRNGYSFSEIINEPFFLQETAQLMVGCLGCILIIPITILLQSYIYTKKASPYKKSHRNEPRQ